MKKKSNTLSLKQQAYEKILERVMDGQYSPGDLLNRRGLAKDLHMSVAPVHEAMIQLERDGFLEALPRQGTRVRTAKREDVRGHLVVREALECQAARMICGGTLLKHLADLKALAKEADATSLSDNQRAVNEVAFHLALVELANCPALTVEYRRVMQVGLFYRINLLMTMPTREFEYRHLALLEDLCSAAPDAAAEAARRHIWSGKPDSILSSNTRR